MKSAKTILAVMLTVFSLLFLMGCPGSGQSTTATTGGGGNPVISSINPAGEPVGSAAATLTVNGSNFASGATVNFNGTSRPTTFVSSSQLTAQLTAADAATQGSFTVSVTNPDSHTSNAVLFGVNPPTVPTITSISPATATAGGTQFALTVNGSNFSGTSVAQWNGSSRTTTFVNSHQVTATIPASDIATQGTAQVTVNTPGVGGGTSNAVTFTINPAGPVNISITGFTFSPSDVTVSAGQTVKWTHNDPGITHSVTRDVSTLAGPSSPDLTNGQTYTFTVPIGTPSGTNIFYHCRFHGTACDGTTFGAGMAGVIRVR